ncbi:NlpC/P60 family protein [Hyphomicrobium sp.]|uniref:C40 family peptidase n=1 Tax=Hyphomicrobium sp. TaxID=82 RepID=UPI002C07E5BE|nr:NlpC/P60 family protein [Hyphomicrobium sp.]HRN87075.1 NlpC/P60 family protein [Hyphomicrobium sp.]HRQ26393.1 NlpC/P60 family protein [Hyphomicrobium sp.]
MTDPKADGTSGEDNDEAQNANNPAATASTPPPIPAPSPETSDTPAPPKLDPRRHAVRADLAAVALRGQVVSPRYSAGVVRQVTRASVPLRREPNPTSGLDTEALFGERVTVYDENEGWAWAQLARDRYVGYIPSSALTTQVTVPTHRVKALGTFIYPAPDIKAPPTLHLPLNAEVRVAEWEERFCRLEQGGFVITRHLVERERVERDFVDVAERFIGTPYLWGGRTRIGIDCSGLVQIALEAAGQTCPRDSDMQMAELGEEIPIPEDLEGLQRGDLVFWKGHVGIMADGVMLLHANAHHMAVVAETLPEAAERILRHASTPIAAIRRLPPKVVSSEV